MGIQVGDIVTVISEKSSFWDKQGKVEEVKDDGHEDGPVGVRFHRRQMPYFVESETECVIRHQEDELRVDLAWDASKRADLIYPGHWHSTAVLKFNFSPENVCMHVGCEEYAARRCLVNSWGTVAEFDFCEKHAIEYDGRMSELFPQTKQDYEPAAA